MWMICCVLAGASFETDLSVLLRMKLRVGAVLGASGFS